MEKLKQILLDRVAIITEVLEELVWVSRRLWVMRSYKVTLIYRSNQLRANDAEKKLKKRRLSGYIYSGRCRNKGRGRESDAISGSQEVVKSRHLGQQLWDFGFHFFRKFNQRANLARY